MLSLTLTCILKLLSLVTLLSVHSISIQAYPITSKPIEGTAENWAWQDWAIQTSEEQSKGKARKVTPKSIFGIAYRNGCPEGQHLDGKRCITTTDIDQTSLLKQQLNAFVIVTNITNIENYDYGDDIGSASPSDGLGVATQFNINNEPLQFSNEALTNSDTADTLPSRDTPLKLNLYGQDLPTNENYTMTFDSMPMEDFDLPGKPVESINSTVTTSNKPANQTLLNSTVTFTNNHENDTNNMHNIVQNNTLMASNNTINNDLLSESSNISAHMADRTFFLSNIDAIALPAQVPRQPLEKPLEVNKNAQRVSIYKDDDALELIKTDHDSVEELQNSSTQADLSQFYEADALIPLGIMKDVTTQLSSDFSTENDSIDYPTFLPVTLEGHAGFQGDTKDLLVNQQKAKTDHVRSVSESSLLPAIELEAQEFGFTTTLEPDATTSFQLDDTTIIEESHPPTNELHELLSNSTADKLQQEQTENQVNVKKLKVKPVKNVSTFNVDNDYVMKETTTAALADTKIEIETSTLPPLPETPEEQHQSEIINEGVHINVDENRFDYQVDMANLMDMLLPTSIITTDTTTTTPTKTETATSEGIISALNQDTTVSTSETDDRKHINKLNNNGMLSNTTILQHSDKKESLLQTNADVFVNNNENIDAADAAGEIVFMVINKQQTNTTANNVMESLATTATTTDSTIKKENKITERTTSKRWSKVMPIFDISSTTATFKTKTTATDETTSKLELKYGQPTTTATVKVSTLAPITEVITTKSSSISLSEKRKSNRRNSKIISLDKYPIAVSNANILSEATKQLMRTIKTPTITTTTTTTAAPTTQKPLTTTESNSYIDPFWWLPLDWHLDRHEETEGRPLLLRLWTSVTSDEEAKV